MNSSLTTSLDHNFTGKSPFHTIMIPFTLTPKHLPETPFLKHLPETSSWNIFHTWQITMATTMAMTMAMTRLSQGTT
jgi:hypothetical protein